MIWFIVLLAFAVIVVASLAAADARRASSIAPWRAAATASAAWVAGMLVLAWPFWTGARLFVAMNLLPEGVAVVAVLLAGGLLAGAVAGLAAWLVLRRHLMRKVASRMAAFGALAVLAVALGGCAVSASDAPAGPQAWREGWADGCNFSRGMSGGGNAWTVDITRRQQDRLYSQGLSDGARWCE